MRWSDRRGRDEDEVWRRMRGEEKRREGRCRSEGTLFSHHARSDDR